MAKVTFLMDNKECNSTSNVTLLEAKRNNIPHVAACGVKVIALHVDC